jgi:hypothetical protein
VSLSLTGAFFRSAAHAKSHPHTKSPGARSQGFPIKLFWMLDAF